MVSPPFLHTEIDTSGNQKVVNSLEALAGLLEPYGFIDG